MLSATILHIALAMNFAPLVDIDAGPKESQTLAGSDKKESWTKARFAVGDVIREDVELHAGFPGLDLPRLNGKEAYVRGNENIFRVLVKTMRVREVIPIGTVILY